jgi:tetratricopeptide (TPR) repeat protein
MPQRPTYSSRSWSRLPPLMYSGDRLECAGVLDEMQDALGGLLWSVIRDVRLWSVTPVRAGLFAAAGGDSLRAGVLAVQPGEPLLGAFVTFAELRSRPEEVTPTSLREACEAVRDWAEREERLVTALAFAEGAAMADPDSGFAAYRAGQIARRRAEYPRAQIWFRAAVARAQLVDDWRVVSLGYAGLGRLHMQRGNLPKAEAYMKRHFYAAYHHGHLTLAAEAMHSNMALAIEMEVSRDVIENWARRASRAYPADHPRLPLFASDIAVYWSDQGEFNRSLPVFLATLRREFDPAERLIVLGNAARAAGATGDRELLLRLTNLAEQARTESYNEREASALLDLARGAAAVREWELAVTAAEDARRLAETRREGRVVLEADALLEAVAGNRAIVERPAVEAERPTATAIQTLLLEKLGAGV